MIDLIIPSWNNHNFIKWGHYLKKVVFPKYKPNQGNLP